MSEAERMYYGDYGGCSCHTMPPCSFCMSLDEEEATAMWNGGSRVIEKLWTDRRKALIEEVPESQWVTIYSYE